MPLEALLCISKQFLRPFVYSCFRISLTFKFRLGLEQNDETLETWGRLDAFDARDSHRKQRSTKHGEVASTRSSNIRSRPPPISFALCHQKRMLSRIMHPSGKTVKNEKIGMSIDIVLTHRTQAQLDSRCICQVCESTLRKSTCHFEDSGIFL